MSARWEQLQSVAQAEVESTQAALPEPLRQQAVPVPVSYEARPGDDLVETEDDLDLLGLFIGPPLAAPDESPLPPQIILFLENLWDLAEGDEIIFRKEIRTTYLHELGHYLGLDEMDLEERGLE